MHGEAEDQDDDLFGGNTLQDLVSVVQVPAPTPGTDLAGWLKASIKARQTEHALRCLAALKGDSTVVIQALRHLAATMTGQENWEERVLAMATVGVLEARGATPLLEAVCRQGLARMEAKETLPAPEEHYALAVLESLRTNAPFDPDSTFVAFIDDMQAVDAAKRPKRLIKTAIKRFRYRMAILESMDDPASEVAATASVDIVPAEPNRPWILRTPMDRATPAPVMRPAEPAASPAEPPGFTMPAFVQNAWAASALSTMPWLAQLAILVAIGGSLSALALGLRVGGLFALMTIVWVSGAFALLVDTFETWRASIVANTLSGLFLLAQATGPSVAWLSPTMLLLGSLLAFSVVGLLLHPQVRSRYDDVPVTERAREAAQWARETWQQLTVRYRARRPLLLRRSPSRSDTGPVGPGPSIP